MKVGKALLLTLSCLGVGVVVPSLAYATASENFFRRGGHISDDWGVVRTRASGTDGFLRWTPTGFDPIIVQESLAEHADAAWRLGEEFAQKYPNRDQRAEKIFYYVRDRIKYTSDLDQFGTGEYAQNADEVVATIVGNGVAQGDCEDSAVLSAVMYKAAGYRSALVLMPSHIATLVYLPEYRKAPRKLTVGGEAGWVWAEATGATNPFGWLPESLMSDEMMAREITTDQLPAQQNGAGAVDIVQGGAPEGSNAAASSGKGLIAFVGIVGILWMVTGRRGGSSRVRRR